MALAGTHFQFSSLVKLDRTKQESWTTDLAVQRISILDSIGNRSRVLRVFVNEVLDISRSNIYKAMQRVRVIDDWGLVTFLGRIVSIEPDFKENSLVLTCRDYLDDISDRTVEASGSEGDYAAVTPSQITDLILNYDTYQPTYQGLERGLARRIGINRSPYQEYIRRVYSQKGDYQSITSSVPGDYLYRGVKTGLEAIGELASEDPQQDLMAFYYTPSPTNYTHANYIANPAKYPRTYWVDLTRDIHDGNVYFITPQTAEDTATPQSADILYFGSNSQFDGLRYTFLQSGDTIAKGTYAGTVQWQFWNGTAWTNFTPTADSKFSVDSTKTYGTTYWTASNLTSWTKRDLGTTPDMPTANDADQSWYAPWASSGSTQPEDVTSTAISKVDHGDEHRGTTRYWVRAYARTGSITTGYVSTVELYTKPNLFHDFRCGDPRFFDEVWKYTHSAAGSGVSVGRDGHGGVWLSLNMTGGNAGTGQRLLWDSTENTTNFIGGATETWYFGSEKPFNGVSLHAFQSAIPDYSNVKFVWQWYSNYFSSLGESWQTISGLTISGNTVANPTVVTTERHHLDTGDTVTITGSNSTPSLNGTHTVTVISATTFSVAVNVSSVGSAGHVVCNNHITATEALSASGDASWKRDMGHVDGSNHYYIDVRWDSEESIGALAHDIVVDEFSNMQIMDQYPYKDLVSLSSPAADKTSANFGLNSATAANPTVITSADASGGTTTNHNLVTGDKVSILGSDTTPSIDGFHTATRINATTFSIPVNVTNAGDAGTLTARTKPPNDKYLYWARCYITTGTPTTVATIRDVKTSNVGTFEYFDRGSEPWVTNRPMGTSPTNPLSTTLISYCYRYDTSASAGSKFTNFNQEIKSATSGTALRVVSNTVANPTVVSIAGANHTISGITVANPTVITTSANHGLFTDDIVTITGANSTPAVNDTYQITVTGDTTFTIPVNVTSSGSQGTASQEIKHDLTTGHSVVIASSNSTPVIDGTREVTVISDTTFSVAVNVTSAGTAGTVTPEKVYALDNGQAGDAIYFGSDEPFTQLRLNISDVLSSSSSGYSAVVWEYYRGEGTDDWAALTSADFTFDFKVSGTNTVIFDMPPSWRPVQPGIKEANATDQSFGTTAYYVRARISGNTSSPATSAAKIVRGWVGPNLWHSGLETGTLSTATSKRHSDPLTYGLTLTETAGRGSQRMPIIEHEIKDHALDFVNKISVRGQSGAYGVAEDTTSIDNYGIVKERIVDDSTLTTSIQCENKARALLEQFKPTGSYTIRECRVVVSGVPLYAYNNKPSVLRAGDLVNVNIPMSKISDETWFVYSSLCSLTHVGWNCEMVLFRDKSKVFEPSNERKLMRDLVTRSRETANAVFQPLDKAVVSGLDFLPQGPGRVVGREEYGPTGSELSIYNQGGSTSADWISEFRWTKKLYENHKSKELTDTPLMRVDHLGIHPDGGGVASGGAGLTFISRDKTTSGTPDFHPGTDEATLYLRNSGTVTEGSGLYIAHRDIFNSGTTYDEWNTDTPKINAEVMVGFTGFVGHTGLDGDGRFTINLPALDSAPLVFTSICGHESSDGSNAGNWVNAGCNVYRWTVSSSKYTAVSMQVVAYANNLYTSGPASSTITAISVANPTVITSAYSMPNNRSIWITGTNSTPVIDGLYYVSNKAGSGPYTYTLNSFSTSVFPVNVTSSGDAGSFLSMGHTHEFDQADFTPAAGFGVMYAVIYNSGKNTTGLNSHFAQNHISHP